MLGPYGIIKTLKMAALLFVIPLTATGMATGERLLPHLAQNAIANIISAYQINGTPKLERTNPRASQALEFKMNRKTTYVNFLFS